MGNYLFLLLILACPLMMILMMRGMHGSRGHSGTDSAPSLDELRRRRDELDRQIEERETERQTPVESR
jgi:hypothetical protein